MNNIWKRGTCVVALTLLTLFLYVCGKPKNITTKQAKDNLDASTEEVGIAIGTGEDIPQKDILKEKYYKIASKSEEYIPEIETAYRYLCNNDPLSAAETLDSVDNGICRELLSFVKENTFISEKKINNKAGSEFRYQYEYDTNGRVTESSFNGVSTVCEYGKNEYYEEHDAGSRTIYRKYNDNGDIIFEFNDGEIYVYEYNLLGNCVSRERKSTGEIIRYEYDESGNCISETSSFGQRTMEEYDESGRCIKITTVDSLGNVDDVKTFIYNREGLLIKKTVDNLYGNIVEEYDYYEDGRLQKEVTTEEGKSRVADYKYKYDDNGNLIESNISYDDGTNSIRRSVCNVLGDETWYYIEQSYINDLAGEFRLDVTEAEVIYEYTFFMKSEKEDEEKNLYRHVSALIEELEEVQVDEAESSKYANYIELITENVPCGDIAVRIEDNYTFCYKLLDSTDVTNSKLIYKHTLKEPNKTKVYITIGQEERFLGEFTSLTNDSNNGIIDGCFFSPRGAIIASDFRMKNGVEYRYGKLRNFSLQNNVVEVDFGQGVKGAFPGSTYIKDNEGKFKKIRFAEDATFVFFYSGSLEERTFVNQAFFATYYDRFYDAGYCIGIKNGVIVHFIALFGG